MHDAASASPSFHSHDSGLNTKHFPYFPSCEIYHPVESRDGKSRMGEAKKDERKEGKKCFKAFIEISIMLVGE